VNSILKIESYLAVRASGIGLDPKFPGAGSLAAIFFNFRVNAARSWGRIMLQSWCGPRKSANFDHGRRREIFLAAQGTFSTLAGNSSVGPGMFPVND